MIVATGLLVLMILVVVVFYLRPRLASDEELEAYQIGPEIPSLFRIFKKTRIQYNQIGKGPDLVLLHGIGASTFIWRALMPLLAGSFRVTAIDMPGFGRSQKILEFKLDLDTMADFLVEFLADIGIEKFDLVGSSMGGTIALWIAKKYPKKCERVLTIAAATHRSLVRYPQFGLKMMKPLHFLINKKTIFIAVNNVIQQKERLTEDLVNGYLLPFRDRGDAWRSFLNATRIIDDTRLPDELSTLNRESKFRHKILWGDRDNVVPRKIQEELLRVLPKSEFEILKGLGHHPFEDDPQKIADIILKFFAEKSPDSSR